MVGEVRTVEYQILRHDLVYQRVLCPPRLMHTSRSFKLSDFRFRCLVIQLIGTVKHISILRRYLQPANGC